MYFLSYYIFFLIITANYSIIEVEEMSTNREKCLTFNTVFSMIILSSKNT